MSWRSPDDIFTILMLIGGDIVQRAVAQLAGSGPGPFTPVAFSFGWLAYAVCALSTSAVGNGQLMPKPDTPLQVVNVRTGYVRENASWILDRLLRDHEHYRVEKGALTIGFYEVEEVGKPSRDWVYWCGVVTIVAQLGLAVIPGVLHGNWMVLIVTAGGTALALVGSGLGQWREEKYSGRKTKENSRDVVVLTRGNGSQFAMVVVSDGVGLRLEDMAAPQDKGSLATSFATAMLAVLWVVLLLVAEGLDGDAWFMLAIGGLGIIQNVVAAGARRSAAALGFRLKDPTGAYVDGKMNDGKEGPGKVMNALLAAERKEPGVGIALVDIFFPQPGGLRPEEVEKWEELKKSRKQREETTKGARESQRLRSPGSRESGGDKAPGPLIT